MRAQEVLLPSTYSPDQLATIITRAHVQHRGTFNMREASNWWRPFSSDQLVVLNRPGFDWNARITLLPGLSVRVHDSYVAGEGQLRASLLRVMTVASMNGTGDFASSELLRFLAEAAWYPTALLPTQGVTWAPRDDASAIATLTDRACSVHLQVTFGEWGFIDTVRTEGRGRMINGVMVFTAWEGRFWQYELRNGVCVPLSGEASWLLPRGPRPYWRGRIESIEFVFDAPAPAAECETSQHVANVQVAHA